MSLKENMSHIEEIMSNSKWHIYDDLEEVTAIIENNLETVTKNFIKKLLATINSIMDVVHCKETETFKALVKWFQLYLKLHCNIDLGYKTLLNYYENSAPAVIIYIIGCLQYAAKEVPNYHLHLLEILEGLVENLQPDVLKAVTDFEMGTIGFLWRVIDLVGDFNTQLKLLQILALLLRQFDEERQNEELQFIKCTKLNLLENKLRTVVQETKLTHVLENSCRDLLNDYNMKDSKSSWVFSFYCKSVVLSSKYKFYKPLNFRKFWIDINHRTNTFSFNCRFKLDANSKCVNMNVVLKIHRMLLVKNVLKLYFNKAAEFSKYSNHFANIERNIIQFTLTHKELQRLIDNHDFNHLRKPNKIKKGRTDRKSKRKSRENEGVQTPKQYDGQESNNISIATASCPKTKGNENLMATPPIRRLRKRTKMFKPVVTENSEVEFLAGKIQKKRKPKRKSSSGKSGHTRTVDLFETKDLGATTLKQVRSSRNEIKNPLADIAILTAESCPEVLIQLTDICQIDDESLATKSLQSYWDLQKQQITGSTKKIKLDTQSNIEKRRKIICQPMENNKNKFSLHLPETPGLETDSTFTETEKSLISCQENEANDINVAKMLIKEFPDSKQNYFRITATKKRPSETEINRHLIAKRRWSTSCMDMANLDDSYMELKQVNNYENHENHENHEIIQRVESDLEDIEFTLREDCKNLDKNVAILKENKHFTKGKTSGDSVVYLNSFDSTDCSWLEKDSSSDHFPTTYNSSTKQTLSSLESSSSSYLNGNEKSAILTATDKNSKAELMVNKTQTALRRMKNIKNFEEKNNLLLSHTYPSYYTNLIAAPQNLNKPKPEEIQEICKTNEATAKPSLKVSRHATEILRPENKVFYNGDGENLEQSNSDQNISLLGSAEKSFEKDFLQMLNNYNKNIKLHIDQAISMGFQNISAKYSQKLFEVARTELKNSDDHGNELEEIRSNIVRLMAELQTQYDFFINKSKDLDKQRNAMKRILEIVTDTEMPNNKTILNN